MPRRTDLKHVLVIGSGPIVIGQACEFDYSGTQACRVLQEEGPARQPRQLQPGHDHDRPGVRRRDVRRADHGRSSSRRIIAKEALQGNKIDAVLATLGGQTALNAAVALHEQGILEKYGVELIGADFDAIQRGEDRQKFKDIVAKVGGESAKSAVLLHDGRSTRHGRRARLPGRRPAVVHHGRPRFRHGVRRRRSQPHRRWRSGRVADGERPDRGIHPRLEGIRTRADARQSRQRRDRLLHRERRSRSVSTPETRSPSLPR